MLRGLLNKKTFFKITTLFFVVIITIVFFYIGKQADAGNFCIKGICLLRWGVNEAYTRSPDKKNGSTFCMENPSKCIIKSYQDNSGGWPLIYGTSTVQESDKNKLCINGKCIKSWPRWTETEDRGDSDEDGVLNNRDHCRDESDGGNKCSECNGCPVTPPTISNVQDDAANKKILFDKSGDNAYIQVKANNGSVLCDHKVAPNDYIPRGDWEHSCGYSGCRGDNIDSASKTFTIIATPLNSKRRGDSKKITVQCDAERYPIHNSSSYQVISGASLVTGGKWTEPCQAIIRATFTQATDLLWKTPQGYYRYWNGVGSCSGGTCNVKMFFGSCGNMGEFVIFNKNDNRGGKYPVAILPVTIQNHQEKKGDFCLFSFEEPEHCDDECSGIRKYTCSHHTAGVCGRCRNTGSGLFGACNEWSHHMDKLECHPMVSWESIRYEVISYPSQVYSAPSDGLGAAN